MAFQQFQIEPKHAPEVTKLRNSDDLKSIEQWQDRWRSLSAEAVSLQTACAEDLRWISELAEFKECKDDDPFGDTIGLWRWMDGCLWDGLKKIRTDVRSLATGQLPTVCELESRLKEFRAQKENLSAALVVAEAEVEKELDPFLECCDGWALEPSVLSGWMPSCQEGTFVPVKPSPPWRGVRGGNSLSKSVERKHLVKSQSASSLVHGRIKTSADRMKDMASDSLVKELHEQIARLEEQSRQAGGPTGGWGEVQHEIFVRIFRMFRRQSSQVLHERLVERLRDVSLDEITAHIDWFVEEERRQTEKRQLLAKWRERLKEIEDGAEEAEMVHAFQEEQRKEGLRRSYSAKQKQRAGEWRKHQQELEEHAATLRAAIELRDAKEAKFQQKRQRQHQEKQSKLVHEYRKKRTETEKAEELAARAAETPPRPSPEVRKKIQKRNLDLLKQCQEDGRRAREEILMRRSGSQPILHKNPAYDHVESNVYAFTASYRQRVIENAKTRLALDSNQEPEPETAETEECNEAPTLQEAWNAEQLEDDRAARHANAPCPEERLLEPEPESASAAGCTHGSGAEESLVVSEIHSAVHLDEATIFPLSIAQDEEFFPLRRHAFDMDQQWTAND